MVDFAVVHSTLSSPQFWNGPTASARLVQTCGKQTQNATAHASARLPSRFRGRQPEIACIVFVVWTAVLQFAGNHVVRFDRPRSQATMLDAAARATMHGAHSRCRLPVRAAHALIGGQHHGTRALAAALAKAGASPSQLDVAHRSRRYSMSSGYRVSAEDLRRLESTANYAPLDAAAQHAYLSALLE
jgi:hypothetical protein